MLRSAISARADRCRRRSDSRSNGAASSGSRPTRSRPWRDDVLIHLRRERRSRKVAKLGAQFVADVREHLRRLCRRPLPPCHLCLIIARLSAHPTLRAVWATSSTAPTSMAAGKLAVRENCARCRRHRARGFSNVYGPEQGRRAPSSRPFLVSSWVRTGACCAISRRSATFCAVKDAAAALAMGHDVAFAGDLQYRVRRRHVDGELAAHPVLEINGTPDRRDNGMQPGSPTGVSCSISPRRHGEDRLAAHDSSCGRGSPISSCRHNRHQRHDAT